MFVHYNIECLPGNNIIKINTDSKYSEFILSSNLPFWKVRKWLIVSAWNPNKIIDSSVITNCVLYYFPSLEIDLSVFLKCNKLARLTTDPDDIVKALKKSKLLEVTADGTKVKRTVEVQDKPDVDECTIYVVSDDIDKQILFSKVGGSSPAFQSVVRFPPRVKWKFRSWNGSLILFYFFLQFRDGNKKTLILSFLYEKRKTDGHMFLGQK